VVIFLLVVKLSVTFAQLAGIVLGENAISRGIYLDKQGFIINWRNRLTIAA
jgi:hypothetical protein